MIAVADLDSMDRAALVAAWAQVFKTSVPKGLSQPFLRRFLASDIQAQRSGGVAKQVMAALRKKDA